MFKPGGLFGPKPGQAALDQAVGSTKPTPKSDDSSDDKKGKGDSGYSGSGFDPRGLERAAKAAKVGVTFREYLASFSAVPVAFTCSLWKSLYSKSLFWRCQRAAGWSCADREGR